MTRSSLAGIALVSLIAALVAWVVLGGDGDPDVAPATPAFVAPAVDFPPYAVPADVIAAWETERSSDEPLPDAAASLVDAWEGANVVQALRALDLFEGDADAVLGPFEAQRLTFARDADLATLRAAGWAAHTRFEAALGELLRKASTTQTPLRALLANPADATAQLAYEGCGDFVLFALDQGLLGEQGELHVTQDVVTLLFRYRWFQPFAGIVELDDALAPGELRAFQRWRLERARVEPDARARYIASFGATYGFHDYPESFALGVLRWQSGDQDAAIDALETAAEAAPDDEWIAGVLARAERDAAGASNGEAAADPSNTAEID